MSLLQRELSRLQPVENYRCIAASTRRKPQERTVEPHGDRIGTQPLAIMLCSWRRDDAKHFSKGRTDDLLSQVQTGQTADSSAKRFAAGQKLQIDFLEIAVSLRLSKSLSKIHCLVLGSKMSMDLDAPVYMSGMEPEQPTTAT